MYDNGMMRSKKLEIKKRDIIDFDNSRSILEDDIVKRYDGFIETIPKKPKFVTKKKVII